MLTLALTAAHLAAETGRLAEMARAGVVPAAALDSLRLATELHAQELAMAVVRPVVEPVPAQRPGDLALRLGCEVVPLALREAAP